MKKLNKVISILLLSIMLLSSSLPCFASQTESGNDDTYTIHTIKIRELNDDTQGYARIIPTDDNVYINLNDYSMAIGEEAWYNERVGTWLIPGAGQRKIGVWADTGNCVKIVSGTSGFSPIDTKCKLLEVKNEVYFSLFPVIYDLGITGIIESDTLVLYNPSTSVEELVYLCEKIMDEWGVMETTLPIDQHSTVIEKEIFKAALIADFSLDVVDGKAVDLVTDTYIDERYKEIMISALGVEPATSYETITKQTKDISSLVKFALDDQPTTALYNKLLNNVVGEDNFKLFTDNVSSCAKTVGSIGDALEYVMTANKIKSVNENNMEAALNVFVDGAEYVKSEELKEIVEELSKEYKEEAPYLLDNIVKGLEKLGVDKSIDVYFKYLLEKGGKAGLKANWYALGLQIELFVLQQAADYNYGELTLIKLHRDLQGYTRNAYQRCYNQTSLEGKEDLQYIYDCARVYCLLKESSYMTMGINTSISNPDTVTGALYEQLLSISPSVAYSSGKYVTKESSNITVENITGIAQKEEIVNISLKDFVESIGDCGTYTCMYVNDLDKDGHDEYIAQMLNKEGDTYYTIFDINNKAYYNFGDTAAAEDNIYQYSLSYHPESDTVLFIQDNENYAYLSCQAWDGTFLKNYAGEWYYGGGDESTYIINNEEVSFTDFEMFWKSLSSPQLIKKAALTCKYDEKETIEHMMQQIRTASDVAYSQYTMVENEHKYIITGIHLNGDENYAAVDHMLLEWDATWKAWIGMGQVNVVDLNNKSNIRFISGFISDEDVSALNQLGLKLQESFTDLWDYMP